MTPVDLRTARLVLDQPRSADIDLVAQYCTDPLFETYMTTPWPYLRQHASHFVDDHVPTGWAQGSEATWALRASGTFLGVISLRLAEDMVGYWLGAPFRGNGYMSEALAGVCSYAFDVLGRDVVRWECVSGNIASASTARAVGFRYTGEGPADVVARDGSRPPAWHGILRSTDSRERQPGWPLP